MCELAAATPARRQRTLIEITRLELALLRLEMETGKSDPSVGRDLNDRLLSGSRTRVSNMREGLPERKDISQK